MKKVGNNQIPAKLVENYLYGLVNQFFKILPLWESGEPSLSEFMRNLQSELIGHKSLMQFVEFDSMYMTLLSILQYLIDVHPGCDISIVKREVFGAISICKKLRRKYCEEVSSK